MAAVKQTRLELFWQETLGDYVTAVDWSANGQLLAATSAVGELIVWSASSRQPVLQFQAESQQSMDGLAFSADGQFVAAGGQSGTVYIWQMQPAQGTFQPVAALEYPRVWIDRLQWHPQQNELAFSLGRYAQVWDAITQDVVTTLHFEHSSVLDLDWHPKGTYLAVGGQGGVKAWSRDDWDAEPEVRELAAASVAITWSADGQYLASGNLDRTLIVWEWSNPYPWQMQGFPGKVRQLAWSDLTTKSGAPLLTSISGEAIVLWEKAEDEQLGWTAKVLDLHQDVVQAIGFQPNSLLFASASTDGKLGLWQNAKAVQILEDAPKGSCLRWHPQGKMLAMGGQNGELVVWTTATPGQGFGR
ncbi:hypothetical protein C7B76_22870 [filamentous cyanobacterium CCP2]|nr:hypothetical protein C7B76_22870 [filamentous cyanobacterium CCP2]